jgi:NAD(P)-dependent dehydrogenase (short-subunit alcohol dehydrogenase family)
MFSFRGKIAVVTGAEKGIGKAIAQKFVENGAKVVIVGIDDQAGKDTAKSLGDNAVYVHCDITDEMTVAALPEKVISLFGVPDILVNNAGIYVGGNIEDVSKQAFEKVMAVNVTGPYLMCHYFIPEMVGKGKGVIVNVSSEAGIQAFKNQISYNVSKAAVLHMTKSIAVDYAQKGIRANSLCPGTTATPLLEEALKKAVDPQAERKRYEQIRPMNRLGNVDEIAYAALCLAADEMGYATGTVFSIDGGYTIQ